MNQTITPDIAAVMPAVRACGLATSLCTITVPPEVFDEGGAPDPDADYIPLEGHIDIPCMEATLQQSGAIRATEVKTMAEITAKNLFHVLLTGYYPAIIPDYRAVVDGVVYDIVNVESDSQKTQTRMAIELATV